MGKTPDPPPGRPLAIDSAAQSARPGEPAFIARPEGAPVYYGFPILEDVVIPAATDGSSSHDALVIYQGY
jgi:hypothetical protein